MGQSERGELEEVDRMAIRSAKIKIFCTRGWETPVSDRVRTSFRTKQRDSHFVLLRRNKRPMAVLDNGSKSTLQKVRGRSLHG